MLRAAYCRRLRLPTRHQACPTARPNVWPAVQRRANSMAPPATRRPAAQGLGCRPQRARLIRHQPPGHFPREGSYIGPPLIDDLVTKDLREPYRGGLHHRRRIPPWCCAAITPTGGWTPLGAGCEPESMIAAGRSRSQAGPGSGEQQRLCHGARKVSDPVLLQWKPKRGRPIKGIESPLGRNWLRRSGFHSAIWSAMALPIQPYRSMCAKRRDQGHQYKRLPRPASNKRSTRSASSSSGPIPLPPNFHAINTSPARRAKNSRPWGLQLGPGRRIPESARRTSMPCCSWLELQATTQGPGYLKPTKFP